MSPDEAWQEQLSSWAHRQSDIKALVQIGSRVQPTASPDPWQDFDYQLLTSNPKAYADGRFARDIAPAVAVSVSRDFGNVIKVTAIYEGGVEADFVILKSYEVALATTALKWPGLSHLWPPPLRWGIRDLRDVAGWGWRIVKGGDTWTKRYRRIEPYVARLTQKEFAELSDQFWTQTVWIAKKIVRGELRAAERGIQLVLLDSAFKVLQEEGRLGGKTAKDRWRRAELWLSPERLTETAIPLYPERSVLTPALTRAIDLFESSAAEVAKAHHWPQADRSGIRKVLAELISAARD